MTHEQLILLLGLLQLIAGMSFFWMGFHAIDLSVNIMQFCYAHNLRCENYKDITLGGAEFTYKETYMNGLKLLLLSLPFIILGTASVLYIFIIVR